ncbi:hypothetical protein ABZX98_26045 [Streptomyces sp. NPDC002992]|uniref:hypothetical protein n=1 Tax=Streptomyces sp. NPDC002992 TaxID=3154273 RepID=UPI0033B71F54
MRRWEHLGSLAHRGRRYAFGYRIFDSPAGSVESTVFVRALLAIEPGDATGLVADELVARPPRPGNPRPRLACRVRGA